MKYNSSRKTLIIPEYGRHVQNLIDHVKTIEDDAKRQEMAESIVNLMLQMNPTVKKSNEFISKMWTHMLKMSNYELNVEIPEGIVVNTSPDRTTYEKLEYPKSIGKYRHYGNYIQKLILKALEMPESPERQDFVRIIGSYMKTAYKQWNKDHYINDESVLEDIKIITKGELSISEDQQLDYLKHSYNSSSNNNKRKSNNRDYKSNKNKKSNKKSYKKRKYTY